MEAGEVGDGDVGFEDLFGPDDAECGVEFCGAAGHEGGLAAAGGAGEDDGGAGFDASGEEACGGGGEGAAFGELAEGAVGDAGELADVDEEVAAAGEVAVDDVEAGAVVELGVLESFGGVELAVGAGGFVEDLGEGADDVVVVGEGFVVVAASAVVAFDEDLGGAVDHDLPDVVVREERGEGAVAGDVAEDAVGDAVGVDEVGGSVAAAVVVAPAGDLGVDEGPEAGFAVGCAEVEGDGVGAVVDGSFEDGDRRLELVGGGGRAGGGAVRRRRRA